MSTSSLGHVSGPPSQFIEMAVTALFAGGGGYWCELQVFRAVNAPRKRVKQ